MGKAPRRFVTRVCEVCEWTGAAVEPSIPSSRELTDCPWCHAPTRVVREEWLFDTAEFRQRAAAFGRLGGLKGGRARAERLSPKRRAEIARAAAVARWKHRRWRLP